MNDLLSNTKSLQHYLIDKVMKSQVNILLDKESGKDSAHVYVSCKERMQALGQCHSSNPQFRNLTWKFLLGNIHEVGDGDALAFVGRQV